MAKILLAEDDKSMRDFLTLALTKAGHDVTPSENGIDALKILQRDQNFDLLLTDIVMPGMDGIELSQKVTSQCPDIKVMFITGFAAVAVGKNQVSDEEARVLSKPFHLKDLVNKVEKLLEAA